MELPNIPEQCIRCLNFKSMRCWVLNELQTEKCFARQIDPRKVKSSILAIQQYELKKGIFSERTEQDLLTISAVVEVQDRRDIASCYYADTHRGDRKGGGEKEKAPHKSKKSGKKAIHEWEGF